MTEPDFLSTRVRCPCCDFLTLDSRGDYHICEVCFWEDDGDWALDDERCRCGPNHGMTLREGRENYRKFGATDLEIVRHVRPPKPYELAERERWNITSGRSTANDWWEIDHEWTDAEEHKHLHLRLKS